MANACWKMLSVKAVFDIDGPLLPYPCSRVTSTGHSSATKEYTLGKQQYILVGEGGV